MNAFSEMDRVRRAFNNPKSAREEKSSIIEKIQNLIFKKTEEPARRKGPTKPQQPLERNTLGKNFPKR